MRSRFKIAFCLLPRRLILKGDNNTWRFVGWVWMQRAYLVKNMNHGWVAFVEEQTEEQLNCCSKCGLPITAKRLVQ